MDDIVSDRTFAFQAGRLSEALRILLDRLETGYPLDNAVVDARATLREHDAWYMAVKDNLFAERPVHR